MIKTRKLRFYWLTTLIRKKTTLKLGDYSTTYKYPLLPNKK